MRLRGVNALVLLTTSACSAASPGGDSAPDGARHDSDASTDGSQPFGDSSADESPLDDGGFPGDAQPPADGTKTDSASIGMDGSMSKDGGQSTGCGRAGARTGVFTLNVTVAGVSRSYEVRVPTSYVADTPVPLAFVFHGLGGNSAGAASFGLQDAAASAGGDAIFVFPQGVAQGSSGVGWDLSCNGHDIAFFDAIRTGIEGDYCIQLNRVLVTGFSWGGDFTNALGCCRGNVIRAIAPASGGYYSSGCTPETPAFRLTSGTADPNYAQADFKNGVTHYQTANHCSSTQSAVNPPPCVAYAGCDQPVIWCSYSGMAHALPPNWASDTWSFFAGFR